MISKMTALRILDGIFGAATMTVLLLIAGLPTEWVLIVADFSMFQIQWLALAIILAVPWLIYAIAMPDNAP